MHDRHRPLILVVDDDPIVTLLASEAIACVAMDVVVATTGSEAITLFGQVAPDAVFLDVFMPDLDGYAVCRTLRTLPTGVTTPIVMMTARDDGRAIDLAYECGATDFVSKPLNPTLLGHRLRYLLRAAQAFRESRESSERLSRAQRLARLAQWQLDRGGGVVWSELSLEILRDSFGIESGSMADFLSSVHDDDRARVAHAFGTLQAHCIDYRLRLPDGSERVVHQEAELIAPGASLEPRLLGATQDVTALRLAERRIERMALQDELTGLPNRAAARSALSQALADAKETGRRLAVLVVGIDGLKRVNATLGRPARDLVLRDVARRLDAFARKSSPRPLVARSGDEDFVVVLPDVDAGEAARFAREILEAAPPAAGGSDALAGTSASVGIAACPDDGFDADLLLERAEIAMQHARDRGRGQLQFYTASMQADVERTLHIETVLRAAIRGGTGLALHYQPKVDLPSHAVCGVEALLRHTPDGGPRIGPVDLVRVAEESGLMVALGEWVLQTACVQAKVWQDEGAALRVAVNVAARQFAEPSFVARVASILAETGLLPSGLELEITEGTILEEGALATLSALKALGVRIALDDFGTGFSSLAYLTKLPIDSLKIDRSFVIAIGTAPKSEAITASIVTLAHSLDIDVVAEGVETELQRAFFDGRGALSIQGWFYAKAMPGSAVTGWIREHYAATSSHRRPLRAAG